MPGPADLPRLSPGDLASLKAIVASAGALLLALRLVPLGWEARPSLRRGWDVALLGLGILAGAAWFNLFQAGLPGRHPSETFHYYVGSKYFSELGYTRLYRCVAVADAEAGRAARVGQRHLRNLETNSLEPAAGALDDPGVCTRRFTPERWQGFQRDLAWFRDRPSARAWHRMQTDHGYNATPVWGLIGGLLANTGPATDGQILALRLLDPALLAAGFAGVAVAFGWRALCVVLLAWGTGHAWQFGWIGGSYLRQIELAAVLLGVGCLRRARPGAAGFLLATAALVRLFPAVLFAGPALQALLAIRRSGRWHVAPEHRRLAAGALAAAALWVPASAWWGGGAGSWLEFADHTRVLVSTPLRNHVGLRTLLAFEPGAPAAHRRLDHALPDPYQPWKDARERAFAPRLPLFVAGVGAYLTLLAAAVRREPVWAAAAVSACLVPVALELTSYYLAILAVCGLLWVRHPPIGVALVALSAAGWALADAFAHLEQIFTWFSLAAVAFAVFAALWMWRVPAGPEPGPSPVSPAGS
jgi:hypothetical protein